ncbi:MAG: AAA family ATPase [Euzebya sp.]
MDPTTVASHPPAPPELNPPQPGPHASEPDPFSLSVQDLQQGLDPEFDESGWVEETNPAPQGGFRRLLWKLSGGRYRPAPTALEQQSRQLLANTRRPFTGARTVAVVSTKGGVGKTTTTLNLGHTLASIRGDRVVALDANPDAGSLGYRVERQTTKTAADLLALGDPITSYSQVRPFTSQATSRLEVIASPDDPHLTRRMGRKDYEDVLTMLGMQYNLILADCGTGILDSATRGVVQHADQLVVVTGPSVDAARAVTYLLSWLAEHGMEEKVNRAIVVVNGVRPGRRPVDVDRICDHFDQLVRRVVTIPWDEELANGATVQMEWLATQTRHAYLNLASSLIDEFVAEEETDPGGSTPIAIHTAQHGGNQ